MLQRAVLRDLEDSLAIETSSPLTRKSNDAQATLGQSSRTRKTRASSGKAGGPRSARRSSAGKVAEVDELSPEDSRRNVRLSTGMSPGEADELSPDRSGDVQRTKKGKRGRKAKLGKDTEPRRRTSSGKQKQPPVQTQDDLEEAEEIDTQEAARRIGKKRPRRSTQADLDSLQEADEAPRKKRRSNVPRSPAAQNQPRMRQDKTTTRKPAMRRTRDADELDGDARPSNHLPVTVQRFTRKVQLDADDGGADLLQTDRAGANAVDVLAQMSEELIDTFLVSLQEQARNTADSGTRREFRTMMAALEAFREELRTRLLEHVSHNLQQNYTMTQVKTNRSLEPDHRP
jgi:hypothetical protein